MLGVFPTWFQIRERGKQYAIAVRAQMVEPEVWGENYDPQESVHLRAIHGLLMDRCSIDPFLIREINPEYDWYTARGMRYNYNLYPIPFGWRHPFLQWLNELVGPEGSKPTVPHNIPEPVNNLWWQELDTWHPPPAPRRTAAPRTGTVNTGRVYVAGTAATTGVWTYNWIGGNNTGGNAGGGTI